MVQPPPRGTASLAIVVVGHELHDRGCVGGALRGLRRLPQQGKLVSGVSWEIGVAVCRAGKQLAKLGRSSSSCRDAAFVQSVGTPLSRKQRRPSVPCTLIWIQDNPKGQSPGLSSEENGRAGPEMSLLGALI
ncbi:hypothetical protein LA080_004702 [Diaporthe eres]|nr:hypothetical protein LA080_004702 [Diaporthe eres]